MIPRPDTIEIVPGLLCLMDISTTNLLRLLDLFPASVRKILEMRVAGELRATVEERDQAKLALAEMGPMPRKRR